MKTKLQDHPFPDDQQYPTSVWQLWEDRIQKGHESEAKRLREITENLRIGREPEEWMDEPDDRFVDEVHQMELLTDAMYAALVVALWSHMESFLKQAIGMCNQALKTREKALTMTRDFCEAALLHTEPPVDIGVRIKALRGMQSGVPYSFDEIRKAIKSATDVELGTCADYATVDAIRVLNNSFKHSHGEYRPEKDKPHTQIAKPLLKAWSVSGKGGEICFAKLPIKDLIAACHVFCVDLLLRLEKELEQRAPEQD